MAIYEELSLSDQNELQKNIRAISKRAEQITAAGVVVIEINETAEQLRSLVRLLSQDNNIGQLDADDALNLLRVVENGLESIREQSEESARLIDENTRALKGEEYCG